MPPQGVPLRTHADMLTYDQIVAFTALAVSLGVHKVRLTGGEPLVRRNLEQLIAMLSQIEGITDLALTTNGQLLQEKAAGLRAAGLHRVNVSLDTLDPMLYAQITRGGALERALAGIRAAQSAGLNPVKINCVVEGEHQEVQKEEMRRFAINEGLQVRFIHRMSLPSGRFSVVEGGSGGDCARCNRLRLTSDGMLMPCLFSDLAYSICSMGYSQALEAALLNKPPKGTYNLSENFYTIGG